MPNADVRQNFAGLAIPQPDLEDGCVGEAALLNSTITSSLASEMAAILGPLDHSDELRRERFAHALASALDLRIDSIQSITHELSLSHRPRPGGAPLHSSIAMCDRDFARVTIHETPNPEVYEIIIVGNHLGSRDQFTIDLLEEIAATIENTNVLIQRNAPFARKQAHESSDFALACEFQQVMAELDSENSAHQLRALMSIRPNQISSFVKLCAQRDVLQDELNSRFNDIVGRSVFEFGGQAARDFIEQCRKLNGKPHPLAFWDTMRLSRQLSQIQTYNPMQLRRCVFAFAKRNAEQPERLRAQIGTVLAQALEGLSTQESTDGQD